MIIPNGNIEFKHKSAGGLDPVTGFPVKPTSSWGEPIPCQYVPKQLNLQARSGGNAMVTSSYEVYLDMPLSDGASEQLRLTDLQGNVVGEYSLIAMEELVAVQEIKITV